MLRDLPLGGDRFSASESTPVLSPYDGAEIALVPRCGAAEVDRAVAAGRRALDEEPLPQWRRAEILDAAAQLLSERVEAFAAVVAAEAAKPIRTARVEA